MEPEYAARYRELYERHWWWRAREEYLVSWLRRLWPNRGRLAILDVGCGDGLFFDRLAEFGDVEGVEADASIVNAASPFRDRIYVGPLDENYRPGKRFDLVLMLDVVEHVQDAVAFLRHGVRLLDAEGRLLITVPAFPLLWTAHDVINHHVKRYTKAGVRRVADAAGMRIEHWRYFDQWTFAAKLLIRLKETMIPTAGSVPKIPPPPVNRALYAFSRLEHLTLGRLPIPFGSSLLIVGSRKRQATQATTGGLFSGARRTVPEGNRGEKG